MTSISHSRPRRLVAGAAAVLAAGLLVSSVNASSATTWPPNQGLASEASSTTTGFHRHFWRGSQLSRAPTGATEMVATADEAEAMEAYCMDRFRSYDPASGTYLGYDGNEHACP